jgi:hypothetical protein
MKLYIITQIYTDYKFNKYENNTYYFNNEDEAIKKLIDLHNELCCGDDIGKKKCKDCSWKKGLNKMEIITGYIFDNCVYVGVIDTDQMPAKINLTCEYGENPIYEVHEQTK